MSSKNPGTPQKSSDAFAKPKPPTVAKRRFEDEYETSEADIGPAAPVQTPQQKAEAVKVRVVTSLIMMAGFVVILSAGHIYSCIFVFVMNSMIFNEILNLKRTRERE